MRAKNPTAAELRQFLLCVTEGYAANLAAHRVRYIQQLDPLDDAVIMRMIDDLDKRIRVLRHHLGPPKK